MARIEPSSPETSRRMAKVRQKGSDAEIALRRDSNNEDEFAHSIHGSKTISKASRKSRTKQIGGSPSQQSSLVFDTSPANDGHYPNAAEPRADYRAGPAQAIVEHLTSRHGKSDVIIATGITDGQWGAAITDLIASGNVERQGQRRGARYCFRQEERSEEISTER